MRLLRSPSVETGSGTQRLEAFSDGVFAIAITLLILEIRVPPLDEGAVPKSLLTALLHLWPSYFAYVLSFVMIGIYWAYHHYQFKLYAGTDHVFNLLNIFFLMCVSFLPFPTAVLAQFIRDPDNQQTAIVLYAVGLFLPAFTWLLIWLYASRGYRLLDPTLAPGFVHFLTRQYLLSNLFYIGAIIISLFHALAGVAVCAGLTLLYMVPPRPPAYRSDTVALGEAGDD